LPWPTMMPEDLRRAVNRTLGARNVEAADVWTEVREWLIKHGVEAPQLPAAAPASWEGATQRNL
jgi:hypothetical protein